MLKTNISTLKREKRRKIQLFFLQTLSFSYIVGAAFGKACIYVVLITYVDITEASEFLEIVQVLLE